MSNLTDVKTVYGEFTNEEQWYKVAYDFANDTGTIADYTALISKKNMVMTDFYYEVETAVTPATTVVMDLGVNAAGTEILSDKASSALTAGAVGGMDTAAPVSIPSGNALVLGIESQAVTAGKINFNFKLKNRV